MQPFLILFITIISINAFAQNTCSSLNLSPEQFERRKTDSAWRIGLDAQISHYVALRKDIIPMYWGLQKDIFNLIDKEDIKKLILLRDAYQGQIESYVKEMRATNSRALKNLRPSGELSTLIVFETFQAYPDTWALLLNPIVFNRRVNDIHKAIINVLHTKYTNKLDHLQECILKFKTDREENRKNHWAPRVLQGINTPIDSNICDIADLLIWAIGTD